MHTVKDKAKLILRVRRIRGQVEAIERALEADPECSDLLAAHHRSPRRHERSDG